MAAELPPPPPDAAAVCDAFALGRPHGPAVAAARGELGRIWRLETSTGRWAVKELFAPQAEEAAAEDVAFQEAALRAGVPMPRPVVGRDGRVLARIAGPGRAMTVRVYTWVDLVGRHVVADLAEVGRILGILHALAWPDDRVPDPWFTAPVEDARWEVLVRAALAAGAPWAPDLEAMAATFIAARPLILAGRHEPRFRCHLDYNLENVLVDRDGRVVVVDWENSGAATAEQELAMVVDDMVPDPAALLPVFLRGYADGGGTATLRDRSSFAMAYAMLGNLVALYATRALDPGADPENRARAAYWIGDIAAHGVTLERTDALLRAAGGRPGG